MAIQGKSGGLRQGIAEMVDGKGRLFPGVEGIALRRTGLTRRRNRNLRWKLQLAPSAGPMQRADPSRRSSAISPAA
jgi:hypothetical protein